MQALGNLNRKNGTKKGSKTPKKPTKNENRTDFCCREKKEESPVSLWCSRDFSQWWVTLQWDRSRVTWSKLHWSGQSSHDPPACGVTAVCNVTVKEQMSNCHHRSTLCNLAGALHFNKLTMTLKLPTDGYEHLATTWNRTSDLDKWGHLPNEAFRARGSFLTD